MENFTFTDWIVIWLLSNLATPIVITLPYVFFWGITTEDGTTLPPDWSAGAFLLFLLYVLYSLFDKYCDYRKKNQ